MKTPSTKRTLESWALRNVRTAKRNARMAIDVSFCELRLATRVGFVFTTHPSVSSPRNGACLRHTPDAFTTVGHLIDAPTTTTPKPQSQFVAQKTDKTLNIYIISHVQLRRKASCRISASSPSFSLYFLLGDQHHGILALSTLTFARHGRLYA